MARYVTNFPVDQAVNSTQFLKRLTSLATGAALQDVDTKDGVGFSTMHTAALGLHAVLSYKSVEHNGTWHTTALITRDNQNATVRVEMLPLDQSAEINRPRKPVVIDILLDELGATGELPFKTANCVVKISNQYVPHCERLAQGTSDSVLPVFYTTKDFLNGKQLDQDEIARRLYGLAHVFVESDKHVRKNLQKRLKAVDSKVSLWPACIIWPCKEGVAPASMSFEVHGDTGDAFISTLEDTLQNTVGNPQCCNKADWLIASTALFDCAGMRHDNAPSRNLQIAPIAASTQIRAKEIPTNDTSSGNSISETQLLTVQCDDSKGLNKEELLEVVIDAIGDSLNYRFASDPDKENQFKRRADVLKGLLDSNSLQVRHMKEKNEKVAKILRGKRGIDKPTEQALAKVGITVTRGGKHPKLSLDTSKRYVTTAPSTSSDMQAWKNLVADIGRKFF